MDRWAVTYRFDMGVGRSRAWMTAYMYPEGESLSSLPPRIPASLSWYD